jgi:hypothetical protein
MALTEANTNPQVQAKRRGVLRLAAGFISSLALAAAALPLGAVAQPFCQESMNGRWIATVNAKPFDSTFPTPRWEIRAFVSKPVLISDKLVLLSPQPCHVRATDKVIAGINGADVEPGKKAYLFIWFGCRCGEATWPLIVGADCNVIHSLSHSRETFELHRLAPKAAAGKRRQK